MTRSRQLYGEQDASKSVCRHCCCNLDRHRAHRGTGLSNQADQDRPAGASRQCAGRRNSRYRRPTHGSLGPAGADRGSSGRRWSDRWSGGRDRAADGYTLVGGPASLFTILPAQKDKLPIDVNRDFAQLGMIVGSGIMFIAVTPKLGVSTFPEFVALAKSKPGQIAIGTNGAGTLPHFAGLVLEKKGGLPITVVPYNQGGTMAAVADIMGGRVHGTIEGVFGLRGPVQAGDLKLIGQMAPRAHARVSRRAGDRGNPARTDRHRLHEPSGACGHAGAHPAATSRGTSPGAR